MYQGIIELESLTKNEVLQKIHIIRQKKVYEPKAIVKNSTALSVEVPDEKITSVLKEVSNSLKPDWYAIFWNDEWVHFVFLKKIFKISREKAQSKDYPEVLDFAQKQGVQKEFVNFNKEKDKF